MFPLIVGASVGVNEGKSLVSLNFPFWFSVVKLIKESVTTVWLGCLLDFNAHVYSP